MGNGTGGLGPTWRSVERNLLFGAVLFLGGMVFAETIRSPGPWREFPAGLGLFLFLFRGVSPIWMTWVVHRKPAATRQRYEESREPGFVVFRALMLIRDG